MILKKPYAILIKHFKKINFAIFFISVYLFYNTLGFSSFVREYISLGIYNPTIQSVSKYLSIFFVIGVFLSILLSLFLGILLYYKKRPYFLYVFNVLINIVTIIIFVYSSNYFNKIGFSALNLKSTYLVRDLINIIMVPQALIIMPLVIRMIGLDLKKFGFADDEEFLEITSDDSEEFEVSVEFDKDRILTRIKTSIRHFKYFYLENKRIIVISSSIFVILFSIVLYRQIFVINKIYKQNEEFSANSYKFVIKETFVTDKDYKTEMIDDGSRKYVIINIEVENNVDRSLILDINKFMLINKDHTYVPTMRLYEKFHDLGEFYKEQTLQPRQRSSYNLLFEVDEFFTDTNYALFYLETLGVNKTKLRKIKLKPKDITTSKLQDTKKLGESLDIVLPSKDTGLFTLVDYEFNNSIRYYFEHCRGSNCNTISRVVHESQFHGDKTLLMITFDSVKFNQLKLNDILVNYGKIIYSRDNKIVESTIKKAVSRDWKGNTVYLVVPKEAAKSDYISLKLTLRTNEYEYILKEK